jgi:SulP family sulfate permease
MEEVPFIDQTGLYAIEDAVLELQNKGMHIFFVGLREQPYDMLKRVNLIPDLVPESHVFATFGEAIDALGLCDTFNRDNESASE